MMTHSIIQWTLGIILILSSLGVVLLRKPVHASLSFLLTLLTLATLYLHLSAEFIAAIQILVYAGAILVLFMFVIILFQDAYQHIEKFKPKSNSLLLWISAILFLLTLAILGMQLTGLASSSGNIPAEFGTIQSIGHALYVDFFFPFEAITLLFLVAVIGALYIGRKGEGI